MALAKRSHKSDDVENFDDVTRNLPSLQFESVLSDEEKELLPLRARSHALTAHACAQATYYACVLAEARLVIALFLSIKFNCINSCPDWIIN